MILRQAHVIQAAQFDKRYIVSVLYADFRYTIAILSQVALLQLELQLYGRTTYSYSCTNSRKWY